MRRRRRTTPRSIKQMLGGEEKQLDFANQIPVHLTYQTAFVDEAGKLQFRDDIYGLDTKLMSILKGSERQVADVAIEQPADPNFKPTRAGSEAPECGGRRPRPFAPFELAFPLNTTGNRSKRAEFTDPALNHIRLSHLDFEAIFRHTRPVRFPEIGGGGTVIPHLPIPTRLR